jgi:hypothetical protein
MSRGDHQDAEIWQTMLLEGALHGGNTLGILHHMRTLESILLKQGKMKEIELLHEKYRNIYEEWEAVIPLSSLPG